MLLFAAVGTCSMFSVHVSDLYITTEKTSAHTSLAFVADLRSLLLQIIVKPFIIARAIIAHPLRSYRLPPSGRHLLYI